MRTLALLIALAIAAVAAQAKVVQAQDYPVRTIKIVVPYPAGGPTDLVGRTIADVLTKAVKQTVVVENKSGAGGTIGSDSVAKAAPDGYTLLLGLMGPMSIAPKIATRLPYDPLNDFVPVRLVAIMPEVLVARPSLGLRSLKEVVDYGKANPGKLPSPLQATAVFRTSRPSFSSARPASTHCTCRIVVPRQPSTTCSVARSI